MDSTVWRTDDSVRRVPAHRFISAEAIASSAFEERIVVSAGWCRSGSRP